MELRLGDQVVVERPQGGVAEALVEALDLDLAESEIGSRVIPSYSNGSRSVSVPPGQPTQMPFVGPHDRLDRGDQTAGPSDSTVRCSPW